MSRPSIRSSASLVRDFRLFSALSLAVSSRDISFSGGGALSGSCAGVEKAKHAASIREHQTGTTILVNCGILRGFFALTLLYQSLQLRHTQIHFFDVELV